MDKSVNDRAKELTNAVLDSRTNDIPVSGAYITAYYTGVITGVDASMDRYYPVYTYQVMPKKVTEPTEPKTKPKTKPDKSIKLRKFNFDED